MSAIKLADDIINAYQAAMLDALQALAPLTMLELCAAAGLGRAMGSRHLMSLRERKLVVTRKPMAAANAQDPTRRRSAFLYTVSQAGRQALARYQRKIEAAGRVQAPTFNTADQPPYEPQKRVYYRNAGNKHIQSRGFPC